MNRLLGLVLAAALAVGVVIAVGYSVVGRLQSQPLLVVHGVIGSEKQEFFQDPAVQAAFRRNGLDVQVDTAGSREMATTVDLSHYDFAFPAGVPAAQKIKTDHRVATTYMPFYTPLAVPTFRPIAQLLVANHVARDDGTSFVLDMHAYLDLVARNARWTGKYLALLQGTSGRIVAQQPIMLSPVVFGVKHESAQRLGWAGRTDVTWADIAARARAGDLRFGMTNLAASNSGFVALVGVAEAFAGTGSALEAGNINAQALKDLFSGQALTAGSSGFLSDSYVRDQDSLDGMINYESVLISLNRSGRLRQPLDLVYPKDGILTADYPMMLLDPSRRQAFDRITAWLRQPDIQRRIMETTNRRPALPQVRPDSRFPSQVLVELPFPGSLDIVNRLLNVYLDEARPPAHPIFVLDTSGSMEGSRIAALKTALIDLTGSDTSLTGQFARFRSREEVTIILFSSRVYATRNFTVTDASAGSRDLAAIRAYVNGLQAGGNTAIYDAVYTAYQVAAAGAQADPQRYSSIVLMTDGENNTGRDGARFLADYRALPAAAREVKTFAILFGEGSPAELQQVADATGGRVFDGRSAPLSQVFKGIRGYQ